MRVATVGPEVFMVLQLFQGLFVVALVSLVLAVPVGLVTLAWPRGKRTRETVVPHAASARA